MHRRTKIRFRKLLIFFASFFLLVMIFFTYKTLNFLKTIGVKHQNHTSSVKANAKTTYTSVILGYGGGAHEGTYLTDTIMVAHVNFETKRALLISIPRDTWVSLPTKSGENFSAKINTVYQLQLFPKTFPDVNVGKFNKENKNGLLNYVIYQITGLKLDSVISVDFDAFVKVIDAIDGVDVSVDFAFTDTKYPVEGKENDSCNYEGEELEEHLNIATESPQIAFPCRYETISFKSGKTHLDGLQALKYSRSRHSSEDGGDFARAKRQQKVIEAIKNKVISPFVITKIPKLLDELSTEIKTDMIYSDIKLFLKKLPTASDYELVKIILSDNNYLKSSFSSDGQFILIPKDGIKNWASIKAAIKRVSDGKPLSPTPYKNNTSGEQLN
jgi:LCP family protein required for cell wall assembly